MQGMPSTVCAIPPPQVLERAANDARLRHLGLPLAVAFNPYFADEARQQEERRRLRCKLEAGRGLVTAVYLQVRVVGMRSLCCLDSRVMSACLKRAPLACSNEVHGHMCTPATRMTARVAASMRAAVHWLMPPLSPPHLS